MGRRILVLKIGALGDVLRTTPILRALARDASPHHVTWVVGEAAAPLLEGHARIDRLLVPSAETSAHLSVQEFDLVLSLDKDAYSTSIATSVRASEKRGFGRDRFGSLVPIHPDARYAYDLGLSDRLKFHENTKTYQQIVFEMCGLAWNGEEYDVPALDTDSLDASWRDAHLEAAGVPTTGGPVVGFNTGAGGVFANKAWTVDGYVELARRLSSDGCRVVLLGGPSEIGRNARIADAAGGAVVDTGGHRTLAQFARLVGACDLVVTGDTLGMHLAIAARVPVIVLFGSTCPQEIELYGRGEKIVTPIGCHPCYLRSCSISPSCQDLIRPEAVLAACRRVLPTIPSARGM
jgi:heptosyltransferase-2